MGRRLGIIIGVNSYRDTAFRPLQYAENDARALAQWLVNTKGGNWAPGDVQHVQGAYATCELIESLITQVCVNVAGPGDLVFVYFAGHAFLDETNGEGHLALSNTSYRQPATGLHLPSLAQKTMGRSSASHILFMFDCFQTGAAWNRLRSSPYDSQPLPGANLTNALQQTADRLICCSCRGNELVAESGIKKLGLFAYQLILGLCGPASDQHTNQITLQRLHAFLHNSLDEQRRPQIFGQERSPIVLVGNMPAPTSLQSSGPLPPQSSGPSPAVSPGLTYSASAQTATVDPAEAQQAFSSHAATAQLSPTLSGQLTSPIAGQQIDTLLQQARQMLQVQKPAEAFNYVEQVLQLDPANVSALILKGQLLGTVGRSEEALYVVDLVLQLDSNNALAWSMRAAILANTGQYQLALQGIERSLELDPNNPETYAIKTSIMGQVAAFQSQGHQRLATTTDKQGGPRSFLIGAGIQILALILGIAGVALPIVRPQLPLLAAFALQSLALALLCINAARGSYLYGFARFFFTLFISTLTAAILGAAVYLGGINKIGTGRVYVLVQNNSTLLVPILFFGLWLALAAALPLLLALGGLIGGLILGVRRKKK